MATTTDNSTVPLQDLDPDKDNHTDNDGSQGKKEGNSPYLTESHFVSTTFH